MENSEKASGKLKEINSEQNEIFQAQTVRRSNPTELKDLRETLERLETQPKRQTKIKTTNDQDGQTEITTPRAPVRANKTFLRQNKDISNDVLTSIGGIPGRHRGGEAENQSEHSGPAKKKLLLYFFQHNIIFSVVILFPTDLDRVERRLGQLMLGRTDWSFTQVSLYIPGTRGGDHKTR